ncbi:MAG: hypothetical protein E7652_02175 [Ruminococcaceae bacterium]|nr:hypothetical protein [Oscillospiraceae bacterium]
MRLAIIGDLQYWKAEVENLGFKMKQIKKFKPGFSFVMGDVGGSRMRSEEGLLETKEYVSMVGCPFHLIYGNHDVEYWLENVNKYDPEATYRKVFSECTYKSYVFNGVLVVSLSIERQPVEDFMTPYTVYVSDEQYEWARKVIEDNRDKPCIIIAHAPVAGSGLRCDRPMHNAALDTYLDQTFKAERWVELLHDNPQIRAWVSAHFHMGHDYDTAITERAGVVHISCGVMTCCTRDERAHTRILDITDDKRLLVYTLDHNNDAELIYDAEIDLTGKKESKGKISRHGKHEILIGTDDSPTKAWYDELHDRYFVATEKGMLWEYSEKLSDFCGALSYERTVDELYVDGDRLIMKYPDKAAISVDLYSRHRWQYKESLKQDINSETDICGIALPRIGFTIRDSKEGVYILF